MQISRIAGALGAEISGVDLSRPLGEEIISRIHQAFLDHLVLVFRDQPLTPAQFLAFGHVMGQPVEYPFVKGIEGYPVIIEVKKLEHERTNFGGIWHSDTTYLSVPPKASMLLARELPPVGGDTLFANQYLAYESLSSGLRRLLDGLQAVSTSARADVSRTREDRLRTDAREDARQSYEAVHPVVRVHPETGRRALYVNVAHTSHFVDMTEEESAPLLQYLHQHQVKPEFTCRLKWSVGAIAMWDNRCTLHNPVNDYHGYRRLMHRITLAG